jgi:riboflavin kinase / FMN adenylyltransferase
MQTVELSYPLQAETLSKLRESGPYVLAIGDFDGVHLGHQEVIGRAVQTGARLRLPSAIMTFDPHPRQVMGMTKYERLLSPLSRKLELFEQLGVHTTFVVRFDPQFMRLSPDQFVEQMLLPLGLDTVFVGFDFTFGHCGAGTPDTLCELAHGRFAVEVVRPFYWHNEKVSSTRIREHLGEGRLRDAATLLGRPYAVRGEIVHGDARGRTIGFPTANADVVEPYVIPAIGVYAVRAFVEGQSFHGVMNIGFKPTFRSDLPQPTFEAHLFDFQGDIYGKMMTIECLDFLRSERKFASFEELITQIKLDAEEAKERLRYFST